MNDSLRSSFAFVETVCTDVNSAPNTVTPLLCSKNWDFFLLLFHLSVLHQHQNCASERKRQSVKSREEEKKNWRRFWCVKSVLSIVDKILCYLILILLISKWWSFFLSCREIECCIAYSDVRVCDEFRCERRNEIMLTWKTFLLAFFRLLPFAYSIVVWTGIRKKQSQKKKTLEFDVRFFTMRCTALKTYETSADCSVQTFE